jgi:GTPase SAR1 family protein
LVILVYSVLSHLSFENLTRWLADVRNQCADDVLIFLVGNKSDMETHREVDLETVRVFKEENNITYCCETSAKSGKNIERLFTDCARFLYSKYKG